MMTGWHVCRKEPYPSCIVVLLVIFLCGAPLFAADGTVSSGAARHEVIRLTQISPERGLEFLGRLKIATASRLPGTNTLLVTAEAGALQKAITLLSLVDTRTEFDIKELGPAATRTLPSSDEIAGAVGAVSIGTFAHPPRDKTKMKAIVDVHNGVIVAIAPVILLQDIQLAVELGPQAFLQRKTLAKPANLAVPVGPTIPATAMLGSSDRITSPPTPASGLAADLGFPMSGVSESQSGLPRELTPSKERQQKLQEMRERVARLQAERQSLSQSNAPPAPAESLPTTVSNPPAGQPGASTAAPSQPAEPPPAAENRPETAASATSATPVSEPNNSLQPGQVVPGAPPAVKPAQSEPKPQTAPVAAAPAPQGAAPVPATAADPPNGEEVLDVTLKDRLPIIELLDLVGKYLNLSYVYNTEEVKGEVTLKLNGDLRGQLRVKDLYPLLEQTLKAANLVTTRHKGNIVTIASATRAADIDPPLVDLAVAAVQPGDTVIRCKFEVKHIDTANAKILLDNMRLGLDVTPIAERGLLIVTAHACRMERIAQLLQIVDQPGEPRQFKSRELHYTMAKTLTEKVKAMAEQMLESVTVTVAEPDPTTQIARTPGESDVAYRTRLAQYRIAQQAQQATQRAIRAQTGATEPKPGVYLDADERTNRVLMIGTKNQLEVVETLVSALDIQQQDLRALQLYRMKFVDAEEVAQKLHELRIISRLPSTAESLRNPSPSARITGQVPGAPRPPTPTTPEVSVASTTEVTEKGLVEEPQVVVVEATNSLLVNATTEQHAKIANIIEYVDSETLLDEIPYKVYQLENSSPKHLAEVLESLIQETVEQQKEGGKIEKTVVSRDERIKIVPDPNTYSLIVFANKKNQEWIFNLIEQLDKRRPQVLIDVTLVEVTKSDVFSYDLNLIRSSPDLASTSGIHGIKPGADTLGKFIQTGGGALSAFYGDDQVQALLETMQSKNYGRVLAKPKLLVNDNQQGKIETKDTTYVEVTSSVPVTSGGAGNQQNLIQTSQNFNPYEAGITLDITPHISEGDLLQLEIVLTRSDFLKSLPTKPPDTRTNQVDTSVTLPNGSTVILGGLLKMNQTKGGSGVPLLKDIPLVGGLFRSINNEDTQSKLYVFVKAEIIRAGDTAEQSMKDLQALSDRNRMAFEKHELEFQTYEDWPGIKPKRVDPPKVLDAQ